MPKSASRVKGIIQSPFLVRKKDYHELAKCIDENTTGITPNLIGLDSSDYYNFYYLDNGDKVDVRR